MRVRPQAGRHRAKDFLYGEHVDGRMDAERVGPLEVERAGEQAVGRLVYG